ncbi:MAG: DUF4214 domain-containing protein [Pyrinomonadaceae bacterium]
MKRACRLHPPLVRWTSVSVCLLLVVSSLAASQPAFADRDSILPQRREYPPNDKARKVNPPPLERGVAFSGLPNLNDVQRRRPPTPETPPEIPSLGRSRRKPIESRNGRRVGDPGRTGEVGRIEKRRPTNSARYVTNRASRDSLAIGANTIKEKRTRSHHAAPIGTYDDQFVQSFFYWALLRFPTSAELTYWTDILRKGFPQGQSSVLYGNRELGMTVFESAEYAARNRNNHWYVYDLYKTYLMREPDAGGWAYWENLVPTIGRENVRHAFDDAPEFAGIVASLIPHGSATSAASSLTTARVDPFNKTGDQLRARDCEWSIGLLSLPGRAGLDLGLGLSYSSLVWTRSALSSGGGYLYFNEDNSSPSPGFRLGFAAVQPKYFDAETARNVFMLITSSGQRVALRQVGTSNIYEAADSSYLQLIDNGSSLLVRSTDGTQLTYEKFENEWQATKIKDRNGNFISVVYKWWGDIDTVTDTLGRIFYFSYDVNNNLNSITQNWSGWWRTMASFGWGASHIMNVSSLTGVAVVGTYQGESIPVLRQVGLLDGSYYTFEYTGAAQVNMIRRYTYDNVQRSYMAYDYDNPNNDCPRITQTRVWAENWTGVNGVPTEVATQFSLPGDGSHQMTAPDGTVYKEFYGTGWQKGLVTQSEVWSGGMRQKWTTLSYTQDNTGVSYQTNPRVTERNIYDGAGNRNRTTVSYQTFSLPSGASCSLPSDGYQYWGDAVNVLRRSHTDYNLSSSYLNSNLRIVGLLSSQSIYEDGNNLKARTDFHYDEPGSAQYQGSPIQHDESNYGSGFVSGRANLSSVYRYDVNNTSQYTIWTMQYNTTGSLIATAEPVVGHQSSIGYADNFSDSVNHNTLAYPTTFTDADGYSSYVQYNYDYGLKTRTQGPPPAGQPQGSIQTLTYDAALRIDTITTVNNGAYTVFWHGPNYTGSFQTVNSVSNELYTNRIFDGLGRLIAVANNNPSSAGGYKAQWTQYDSLGRVKKQSNPTEIDGYWNPYGDDGAGAVYTQQSYDWKGRPAITTNQDGTQRYASYEGCGCAGGEIGTITDEVGRQRKVYEDVLGRPWKTEVMNGGSVYTITANTFNALDQVTLTRITDNTTGAFQDTSITYDGYGRPLSKHLPQQNSGTAINYSYNSDDTLYSVTDARGASATYGYNGRHQVTSINYSTPSGVTPTANVIFAYDAAGNRTSMTDGLGSKSYDYDQLSRMTSETRYFSVLGQYYTLSYGYNLAGGLTRSTDATNMTINYGYDSIGRLNSVTGSDNLYGGVSNYAYNYQYRAWGGLKSMVDGSNHSSSVLYNAKMRPSQFEMSGSAVSQNYDYYNDGRVSFVHSATDLNFDRSYFYDHAGRLIETRTGGHARGDYGEMPYFETFGYDAFDNLKARESDSWNWQTTAWDVASYSNYRRAGWGYDADGRNTSIEARSYTFDAAGRQTFMTAPQVLWNGNQITVSQTSAYDADGAKVCETASGVTTYYLRSSVLGGQIIEEINSSGQKNIGYVYLPSGKKLAVQSYGNVAWKQTTPLATTEIHTSSTTSVAGRTEFDPLGADISLTAPPEPPPVIDQGDIGAGHFGGIMDARWTDFFNVSSGCSAAGVAASCSGPMSNSNLEAEMRAFFGYRWYDLPGNANEAAQGEERYSSIYLPGMSGGLGYDPEFNRVIGSVTVTYSSGAVQRLTDPTLDEYQGIQTAYLQDTGIVDLNTNTVTIFGGAEYFVSPQNPVPVPGPDPTKKPRGGMDEDQWKNFLKGYNLALSKLSDPNCLGAISVLAGVLDRDGPKGAKAVLQGIGQRNSFVYVPVIRGAIAQASGTGFGINTTIRLTDRFFLGELGMSNLNRDGLPYAESLASTILHELVHALGGGHANDEEHKRMNDRIHTDCFGGY